MNIDVRYAAPSDETYLAPRDTILSLDRLRRKVADREVLLALARGNPAGWLRFGLCWDLFPFLHGLFVEESLRRRGLGRALVAFWEQEMRRQGHALAMTSTDAHRPAQHFYRALGYRDCGSLLFPRELFPEATAELVLLKTLSSPAPGAVRAVPRTG